MISSSCFWHLAKVSRLFYIFAVVGYSLPLLVWHGILSVHVLTCTKHCSATVLLHKKCRVCADFRVDYLLFNEGA